jgi:hypothetical protein
MGEEILFQDKYSFSVKAESPLVAAYAIERDVLLNTLNPSTLNRLRKCYQ